MVRRGPPNRNRGNNNRRIPVRTSPNRASTTPSRTFTRRFQRLERVMLNNTLEMDANCNANFYSHSLDMFTGASPIASTFEYYRVVNVKVQIMPACNSNVSGPPANVQQTPVNSAATTVVYTAVDWTANGTAGIGIRAYDNVQTHTISASALKTVCNYKPKLNSGDAVRTNDTWLTTTATSIGWNGFQMYVLNPNGARMVWQDPSNVQAVNLVTTMTVEFKQPTYSPSSLLTALDIIREPDPLDENKEDEPPMRIRDVRSFL